MTPTLDDHLEAVRLLRVHWAERDARYAKGPAVVLTDAQVELIRAHRVWEALSVGASDPMVVEARYWTPPTLSLR
jgi:hypothetical protein